MCPHSLLPENLEQIVLEIKTLKKNVRALSKEVDYIRRILIEDPSPVEKMLIMRGMELYQKNPPDQLFFPVDLPSPSKTRFFEMMHKYSFRLVLRDIIKHQERFTIEDLTHYCDPGVAMKYCEILGEMGVIVKSGKGYRTSIQPLYSFGPTLEWFVAEMFKREFASPAVYGATLKRTASGGDYDVIASWNRRLVYVEVKSSPPKGVESSEVRTFLSRIEDLHPDVAILFEDTQLRMKDKLVLMFEKELEAKYGEGSRPIYPVERLVDELFHIRNRIFIVNSKKDVVANFATCLKHYLSRNG